MTKQQLLPNLTLLAILALFGVASFVPLESMWGINHLAFLSAGWRWLYALTVLLVLWVLFGPLSEDRLERGMAWIDRALWGGPIRPRLLLVATFTVLFFVFRVQTHLLGDGYTWLAEFGRGAAYIHKQTEPGSIYILRWIQFLLGGYTGHTALTAFQIMSILSGAVVLYFSTALIGRMVSEARLRLLGLVTLVASGSLLLFFGYVEFYPITWAAVTVFLYLSWLHLEDGDALWPALVAFLVAFLMHLQALYFLPGVAWLVVAGFKKGRLKRVTQVLFFTFGAAGVVLMVWLYHADIAFEVLLLPLFKGRPPASDISLVSLPHLRDLSNLVLLVFPGLPLLLMLWIRHGRKSSDQPSAQVLGWLSAGSLTFLLIFGAAVTMGRDWDIMSLSLLAPVYLVLYQLGRGDYKPPARLVLAYGLTIGLVTLGLLAVNTRTAPTEERFRTLLNSRNRNGWVIYANHFLLKGDTATYNEQMREMARLFPRYADLGRTYHYLESGDYRRAYALADSLVKVNPYEPDFLQVLGNAYGKLNRFDSAEYYYHRALRLKPYQAAMLNELGQLYMKQHKYAEAVEVLARARRLSPKRTFITESLALARIYLGQLDDASALADSLFAVDPNDPGAQLIKLTVALRRGDKEAARYHYREFLAYGKGRSDYEAMKEYYRYLQ